MKFAVGKLIKFIGFLWTFQIHTMIGCFEKSTVFGLKLSCSSRGNSKKKYARMSILMLDVLLTEAIAPHFP